jgi:hypothetical protein
LEEFPKPVDIKWHNYDRQTEKKLASYDERTFGKNTRSLFYQFNSKPFLEFLSTLTGIPNLISDPYLRGGGLHQIKRGGFLKIHVDFNKHDHLDLDRRLNVLLYLNTNWKEEYGGHLELWDKDMKQCGSKILPVFNRCAIFSTTSFSFHGHPELLQCPEGMTRKSMALYYYTQGRPSNEVVGIHPTVFKERPTEKIRGVSWRVTQDLLPPVVWRFAKGIRDKYFSINKKIG